MYGRPTLASLNNEFNLSKENPGMLSEDSNKNMLADKDK